MVDGELCTYDNGTLHESVINASEDDYLLFEEQMMMSSRSL